MGIFDFLKRKKKAEAESSEFNSEPEILDRSNWTGENFEFLITGNVEVTASEYDELMTPNSFSWEKTVKNDWTYYKVGQDEFSYSWEMPGIQFTFNKEVKFEKAKQIADEIMENLHSNGQMAELVILEKNKVYRFD